VKSAENRREQVVFLELPRESHTSTKMMLNQEFDRGGD
jgi:hypothetical protein